MKRLMMILMAMLILPTHAADVNEVCKRDALVMIILKNGEDGRVDVSDPNTMRWSVVFDNDPDYDLFAHAHPDGKTSNTIKGRATCNGKYKRSSDDGTVVEYEDANPGDANTFLKAAPKDVGVHCWCKMDGPVTSWWTYFKQYASEQDCADYCTDYCADTFANNTTIYGSGDSALGGRMALFGKIW